MFHLFRLWIVLAMAGWVTGCATSPPSPGKPPRKDEVAPLRVGVTPNFPPLVFNQQGTLAGVEVDLMRIVGRELGRPVSAVVLPWEEIIDSLLSGHIDVIMSGISVTPARTMRVAFTDPWMTSGLMAAMRQTDTGNIKSIDDVKNFYGRIGVLSGTTGHDFVRRNCPNARLVKIASAGDAAVQLQRNQVDLFVDDIPSILWQVSVYEAELAPLMERLTEDQIAWAVRRDNMTLMQQLNDVIRKGKQDGTIDAAILKWIPYYESIK